MNSKPHFVYRFWDSYGLLLYIGCSVDPSRRMSGHRGSAWFPYAETLSVVGPWDFTEARRRETEAINAEASYFNVTQPEADAKKRCLNAAKRALYDRGDFPPRFDIERYDVEGDTYWDEYHPLSEGWDRRKNAMQARLKATASPYMDDRERLARYLAAREDAECVRQERAA